MKLLLALVWMYCATLPAAAQSAEWLRRLEQVRLLTHTYEDILRILGRPSGSSERRLIKSFQSKHGRFVAVFASGQCVISDSGAGRPNGWKVPAWTVISVSFAPKKYIEKSKLPFK